MRRQMVFGRFAAGGGGGVHVGVRGGVCDSAGRLCGGAGPGVQVHPCGEDRGRGGDRLPVPWSQTWLDASQVDRPLWEHEVVVTVPRTAFTKAMMFIGGGGNPLEADDTPKNDPFDKIALATKSIVAHVKQIPSQPLRFPDETDPRYVEEGRKEDIMIAYGWDQFLQGEQSGWPGCPMKAKAVVRAMDLVLKEFPKTDGFFVAGRSKRGWTTWTVAAVDKRVGVGIARRSWTS